MEVPISPISHTPPEPKIDGVFGHEGLQVHVYVGFSRNPVDPFKIFLHQTGVHHGPVLRAGVVPSHDGNDFEPSVLGVDGSLSGVQAALGFHNFVGLIAQGIWAHYGIRVDADHAEAHTGYYSGDEIRVSLDEIVVVELRKEEP